MKEKLLKAVSPIFLYSSAVFFAVLLLYRLEIFMAIRSTYPEFASLSVFRYAAFSLRADSGVLIIVPAVLLLISVISKKSVRAAIISSSVLLILINIFYAMSLNFFRTYETALSMAFWSDEISTGLGDMITSTAAETPFSVYLKIAAAIIIIPLVIRTGSKEPLSEAAGQELSGKVKIFYMAVIPLTIMISFFIPASLEGKTAETVKKQVYLLNELASNPLTNMLSRNHSGDKEENTALTGDFAFGLNTESITAKKRIPGISNIPAGKKYNIIFYFFESTPIKYFEIESHGKKILPNWHRIKKNSLFARNHYANYPLSANAMLSIFTSAYDHDSKDLVVQKHSGIKLKSISEILKDNGYRTAVIHTGDLRYAGQRRFLSYRSIDRIIDLPELEKIPPYNFKVGWGVDERAMTEPSVKFMKKDSSKPFFMSYFPVNPHHPYSIPEGFERAVEVPKGLDYKKRNWLNYLNSLHYADYCLGQLIDRLEDEGLMENTILFLFADHGEAFYQHRKNYNHPFFLYEENVHVPLMIYSKKFFKEPITYEGITRHVDIPATVLDILNIRKDEKHEGLSILSSKREQLALLHTFWKDDFCGIRDGKWKYIRKMDTGVEELYNLEDDPDEMKNIISLHSTLAEKFRDTVLNSRAYKKEFYKRMIDGKTK